MDRNHRVYQCRIEYDAMMRIPDPEAPGSGETVAAGIARSQRVVTIVAPDVVYAKAWLIENPHRFPKVTILSIEDVKIDAVIELHTY